MDNTTRDIARLKSQINSLAEQLDALIDSSADEGKSFLHDTKDQLHDSLDHLKDYSATAGKQVKKSLKQAEEYVHENPWQVIAGAAALGVLAGIIMSRRD